MVRKEFRQKVLAGLLATLTAFGAMTGLPAAQQTVHAEETGLPTETNTSFATARELVFGTSMAGTLPQSSNKRYYRFALNEAGSINFGIEKSNRYCDMEIKIYDASQTEVYSNKKGYGNSFSLDPIFLTGGSYYMMIGSTSGETSFSFVATMDTTGESFTETQDSNNDMASNASAISLQKKYKGVLAANDDIDYFKFQVPAAGQITLNLTNSTSGTVAYGVYDDSVNPTYTNTLYKGNKVSQPVPVKKGTYYLAIAKQDVNKGMGSYTFTIDYKKKNTAAPKLKSAKNTSNGTMTVKWGRVSGADGYEVWYSRKSNFKGSSTVKNEYSSSVTSASYYGLGKNRTYYVRVRAYTVVNGVKDYGKWSGKKAVKIKK